MTSAGLDPPPRVEARGLARRFGPVIALDAADLDVRPGSVHALLGENGAGKSTLAKCLVGALAADRGRIVVDGRDVTLRHPRDAHALGLGMVWQHFSLVPCLTVLENLVLARPDAPRWIDWRHERAALDAFLEDVPLRIDPGARVADLAAGEKQRVEVVRQLRLGHRVLFLDEPTSVLTPQEADALLGRLRALADAGRISVVLTTHKLDEVIAHATHVTVLRRGRVVADAPLDRTIDAATLATWMVGHAPPSVARPAPRDARQPARLSIRALRVARAAGGPPVAIDALDVHAGEIVGVAGVSGNGQRELVEALCGQRSVDQGAIDVDARPWRADRASMRAARFGCVPESPLANATAPDMALADNLVLRVFDRAPIASRTGRVRRDALRASAQALAARFAVQSGALGRAIATLSGGNVQRAVLGRELVDDTRLLVAVNPAFGLDVGAAADVRRRLVELRATGCAVLLVSEDLDELITLSDRIVVMFEGRVVLSTLGVEADRQALGLAMAGHSAIASARADN